ncbi:MAG: hypothetical protein Q9186_003456 [Xanthomendoza sp. 1 TL-2023]
MLKSLGQEGKGRQKDAEDLAPSRPDTPQSTAGQHSSYQPAPALHHSSSSLHYPSATASSLRRPPNSKRPTLRHSSTEPSSYATADPLAAFNLIDPKYFEQQAGNPQQNSPRHSRTPPSLNQSPQRFIEEPDFLNSPPSSPFHRWSSSPLSSPRQRVITQPQSFGAPPSRPPPHPPLPLVELPVSTASATPTQLPAAQSSMQQESATRDTRHNRVPLLGTSQEGFLEQRSPLSLIVSGIAPSLQQLPASSNMDPNRLAPAAPAAASITMAKERTMRIAKEQQRALTARLKKNSLEMPPFEFLELIGKGAFGRVFKANDLTRKKVVALKVVDVDPHDFKVHYLEKDESIQTVLHEIKILTQLRDSNAKNINMIIDAFSIHSQLWIVTEYCPGGSLHTLMQGVGSKLEEKYIVPVARELAVALRAIHAAGIIHRDVKAANVMIHENGSLQLIDFGVSGLLQTGNDKRSTIIGTPHWMPPEMSSQLMNQGPSTLDYATEIDVWAYGCTLYEIATGNPPNHRAEPGRKLTMMLKRSPPTLKEKDFSDGLVDLVDYIMKSSPQDRPSMQAVLQHEYVLDTEVKYPTKSLANLVKLFYRWEYSGGQRTSLFMPGGAEAAAFPTVGDQDEEWNFSTTVNFDNQNSASYLGDQQVVPSTADLNFDFDSNSQPTARNFGNTPSASRHPASASHKPKSSLNLSFSMSDVPESILLATATDLNGNVKNSAAEHNAKANIERGERSLAAIFDPTAPAYQYGEDGNSADDLNATPTAQKAEASKPALDRSKSDLPLRNATSGVAVHKEVDKSGIVKTPSIDLANVNTIKANRINSRSGQSAEKPGASVNEGGQNDFAESSKRATMEWTFASAQQAPKDIPEVILPPRPAQRGTLDWSFATAGTVKEEEAIEETPPVRPSLRHQTTQPVGIHDIRPTSILDMDALLYNSETDSSIDDYSALTTAVPSDDETYAAYDLSDAQEPIEAIDPLDNPTEDEDEELPEAHPLSSLMAPAKLKMKMIKTMVFDYEVDASLAEAIVIGDGADPENLTHGNEEYAEDCVETWIAQEHPNKPTHLRLPLRRDIMKARLDVFNKYLTSGNYPFEQYITKYDNELLGAPYESSGNDSSDAESEDTEREHVEDSMPKLSGVDVTALEPGAGDEALKGEFENQLDQYVNRVLPSVDRKLGKMLLAVEGEEEDGEVEDGDAEGEDGGVGDEGDEGGDEA